MRKYDRLYKVVSATVLSGILLCSCSNSDSSETNSSEKESIIAEDLIGSWDCREAPAETDEIYTGYLHLEISSDGSYSMYDAEAGNPSIKGIMKMTDDGNLLLINTDNDDFDPPAGWENMSKEQEIDYKLSAKELELAYTDNDGTITLIFDRCKE